MRGHFCNAYAKYILNYIFDLQHTAKEQKITQVPSLCWPRLASKIYGGQLWSANIILSLKSSQKQFPFPFLFLETLIDILVVLLSVVSCQCLVTSLQCFVMNNIRYYASFMRWQSTCHCSLFVAQSIFPFQQQFSMTIQTTQVQQNRESKLIDSIHLSTIPYLPTRHNTCS